MFRACKPGGCKGAYELFEPFWLLVSCIFFLSKPFACLFAASHRAYLACWHLTMHRPAPKQIAIPLVSILVSWLRCLVSSHIPPFPFFPVWCSVRED